jgi:hypothetical protein
MTVSVFQSLIDKIESVPPDHQLETRLWWADRIRLYASKQSLGVGFLDVTLVQTAGVPGPSVAVFTFRSQRTNRPAVDQMKRREQVWEFVRNVRRRQPAKA